MSIDPIDPTKDHNRPMWREDHPGILIADVEGATEHARDDIDAPKGKSLAVLHTKDQYGQIGFIARGFGKGGSSRTGAFHAGGDKTFYDAAKEEGRALLKHLEPEPPPTPEEIAFAERMAALDP